MWGERGAMGRLYDALGVWRDWGVQVSGKSLPTGHNLPEEIPDVVLAEVLTFLRA